MVGEALCQVEIIGGTAGQGLSYAYDMVARRKAPLDFAWLEFCMDKITLWIGLGPAAVSTIGWTGIANIAFWGATGARGTKDEPESADSEIPPPGCEAWHAARQTALIV